MAIRFCVCVATWYQYLYYVLRSYGENLTSTHIPACNSAYHMPALFVEQREHIEHGINVILLLMVFGMEPTLVKNVIKSYWQVSFPVPFNTI